MIAVMQAHVDGKPIERRGLASPQWVRVKAPNWDWSDCDYRIATIAPGHNPDGLTVAQVGDGYRLLDDDEVDERWQGAPIRREIDALGPGETWDNSGWRGGAKDITYRTKLSREELAKLRNPVAPGHNPKGLTVAPGHNPNGLTVAQVGDGYRLLDEDEVGGRYGEERSLREIECFLFDRTWDNSGWWGASKERTFRTKLSREELARLREARPEPSVTIPKSEYERLQQAAEVVAKLQALALRPSPPPQPGPSDPASPTPTGQ